MEEHDLSPAAQAVVDHLSRCFPPGEVVIEAPVPGPMHQLVPHLHIARIQPDPTARSWLYVTASLWPATQREGHGLDFALFAPAQSSWHVETLTTVAYYHATGGTYALGHGHTVAIGQPWLPGSTCDYLLVSLPYPWGQGFEICPVPGGHTRLLWLLPITADEKAYRHEHGLEALEQRLEAAGIAFLDPGRPSTVPPRH